MPLVNVKLVEGVKALAAGAPRNEGSEPVGIYAAFLAPTGIQEFLAPAPAPRGCPF